MRELRCLFVDEEVRNEVLEVQAVTKKRRNRRTNPPRAKVCPSGKARFPNEMAARLGMDNARGKYAPRADRLPRRVYRCPECYGWHMTASKG